MAEVARLLSGVRADRAPTLEEHLARYGSLGAADDADAILAAIERSGLRGRGGADFPVATKMRAVRDGRGPRFVVANGTEGEPASRKDTMLMTLAPHLVIDGAVLAARAVGAAAGAICVAASAGGAVSALERALEQRRGRGLDEPPLSVFRAADAYISGEESALVNQLGGGPPKPTATPPRPFERGVEGRPTLVQNVETLAHVAQIARFGPGWFRECGNEQDPGTALITISAAVLRPGVYEIECGTPLAEMVSIAGGLEEPVQAFLVGGYFGSWLTLDDALAMPLAHTSMRAAGGSLGSGVVVALPQAVCGVTESARVARWFSDESAGQCGPCTFGLAALADAVEELAASRPRRAVRGWIERWRAQVAGRGACHHPDGALRFLDSALVAFAEELSAHERGRCGATTARRVLPLSAPTPTPR